MQDIVYHQFASTFDTHWWSDHRRALISRFLNELGVEADGTRSVLEIGCGAGNEHAFLSGYGQVTGIEISEAGLGYCRQRGYHELIAGDLNAVELPSERFDLVADFHVLYHSWVRDPGAVLTRLGRALKPGGHLVLSEPAYEMLRRGHDEHVMAARRWTRANLLAMVRDSGFEVERCTGFLALLAPAVIASLMLDKLRGPSHGEAEVGELRPPSPFVDRILRAVMALERLLIRVHPLPVGTCWAVVARRTS